MIACVNDHKADDCVLRDGVEELQIRILATGQEELKLVGSGEQMVLRWEIALDAIRYRFYSSLSVDRSLPPAWGGAIRFEPTRGIPLVALLGADDESRFCCAVDAPLHPVEMRIGVVEENARIAFTVRISGVEKGEVIRVFRDQRRDFYARIIQENVRLLIPAAVLPAAGFEPVYSTWYAFHQNLRDSELEKECRMARQYGLSTLIVDDGWQTSDTGRGYAFCGDWEIDSARFRDFEAHVKHLKSAGFHYMLWCAPALLGEKSRAYELFQDRCMGYRESWRCGILDPRYPEVRQYLVGRMAALAATGIDGLKLDFIDSFVQEGEASSRPGRDCAEVGEGVARLLQELGAACRAFQPDFLIEFRQQYIGAAMQQNCTMMRAADCPGDFFSNRIRTLELRLFCPDRAVHSDMLMWDPATADEEAALQLLNVLFAVPQLSVRFGELSETRRRMLRFWLGFMRRYREVLLQGELRPVSPELNFPVVYAETDDCMLAVVYAAGVVVKCNAVGKRELLIVNATGSDESLTVLSDGSLSGGTMYDCYGNEVAAVCPEGNPVQLAIPVSGLFRR